jgi:hypothetical protein
MISEEFFIYLLFQMIVLVVNIMGYTKIPALSIFAIGFELAIMVQTIIAFGDYWGMGIMFILMNLSLPIYALSYNMKR